jgi:hypothetical protein
LRLLRKYELHLDIIEDFAERFAGIPDLKIVDPTGQHRIDLLYNLFGLCSAAVPDGFANLSRYGKKQNQNYWRRILAENQKAI